MALRIYWTHFAKSELESIFNYYKKNASKKVADGIITGIVEHTMILINHPEIGTLEPLLEERKQEFRYLICNNYKIIYWYNRKKQRIEIFDVFDARQNPIKIKQNR